MCDLPIKWSPSTWQYIVIFWSAWNSESGVTALGDFFLCEELGITLEYLRRTAGRHNRSLQDLELSGNSYNV